jgi:hypothetical protein
MGGPSVCHHGKLIGIDGRAEDDPVLVRRNVEHELRMIWYQELLGSPGPLPNDKDVMGAGLNEVDDCPDGIPGFILGVQADQLEEKVLPFFQRPGISARDLYRKTGQRRRCFRGIGATELDQRAVVGETNAFQRNRRIPLPQIHVRHRLEVIGVVGQEPHADLTANTVWAAQATDREANLSHGRRRIRTSGLDQESRWGHFTASRVDFGSLLAG